MLLSIIIPVFNGEKFLSECLESVRACPSLEMECIIVNDGSTDRTEEISREFASKDSRFSVINKENSGVSDSRNMGIAEATGEYLFFLDADDYIDIAFWPEIITKANIGKFDMIAFSYYNLFEFGTTQAKLFPKDIDIKYVLLSTVLLNCCWGKLLRRDIINDSKLTFRKGLKISEDVIFIIDFVRNAKDNLLSNSPIIFHRIHSGGVMQQATPEEKLSNFTELFIHRKEYLADNYDVNLEKAMYRQFFSIVTDLFRSYARGRRLREIRRSYYNSMSNETVRAIMRKTNKASLFPVYKKIEFALMRGGLYMALAVYFKIKCGLTALKVRLS